MNIVRVVFEEFLQFADEVFGFLDGEWDYPTFVENVEKLLDDLGKKLCREVLEAADAWLKDNPKERQGWTVVRRAPKSLLTPFGEVHYERRYYYNEKLGTYAYLVDQAIGITPHTRIDTLVKTRLVDAATDMSYRKAGKQGWSSPEDTVSGQTVMNVIRETFLAASPIDSSNGKRTQTRYLHVQADEDHIKKQDGGIALAKLVYTTDGYGRGWGERRPLTTFITPPEYTETTKYCTKKCTKALMEITTLIPSRRSTFMVTVHRGSGVWRNTWEQFSCWISTTLTSVLPNH
jgi:hypothetical protein